MLSLRVDVRPHTDLFVTGGQRGSVRTRLHVALENNHARTARLVRCSLCVRGERVWLVQRRIYADVRVADYDIELKSTERTEFRVQVDAKEIPVPQFPHLSLVLHFTGYLTRYEVSFDQIFQLRPLRNEER